MLSLHSAGKLSDENMNDFKNSVTWRGGHDTVEAPDKDLEQIVKLLAKHVKTKLSKGEIEKLIYAVS